MTALTAQSDLSSYEAEIAVLGSVLIGGNPSLELITWLKPTDFFELKHQWIFEAMRALHEAGRVIDIITVAETLRVRKQYEDVGGSSYLTSLINNLGTHIYIENYAGVVEALARRRTAVSLAGQLAQTAQSRSAAELLPLLEQMQKLLASTSGSSNPFRQFLYHITELNTLAPVKWLIPGEIPERGIVILYGASGVGKSFVAVDYAMRLSETVPILYVATEGEWGYQQRVRAWAKHHKRDVNKYKMYFFLNVVALLDAKEYQQFADVAKVVQPKVIIIDTLAHSMIPGDENNTRDMSMFVKAAKQLQKLFDCAVVLVHHTNKEGRQERGNSALRGAADVMIRLDDMDDVICVECTKSKDAQKFPTRYIRLLSIELEKDVSAPVVVAAELVKRRREDPLTVTQQRILDTLAQPVFKEGATAGDLEEVTSLGRGQVYRALSGLLAFEFVSKSGSLYSLSVDGLSKVTHSGRERDSHDSPMTHPHDSPRNPDDMVMTHMTHQNRADPQSESGESPESRESCESKSTFDFKASLFDNETLDNLDAPKPTYYDLGG